MAATTSDGGASTAGSASNPRPRTTPRCVQPAATDCEVPACTTGRVYPPEAAGALGEHREVDAPVPHALAPVVDYLGVDDHVPLD